jgi:protein-L-isoaspartate(D-aspartate) O-methyltransferase
VVKKSIDRATFLEKQNLVDLPLARASMVERLARVGYHPEVLQALLEVPRHAFAPIEYWKLSYRDEDLWLIDAALISAKTVATMAHHLDLNEQKRVLEVGCGTGYQTAVWALLSQHVYTTDRFASCVHQCAEKFSALELGNISIKQADGLLGWEAEAPFDAIIINAGLRRIPPALIALLNPQAGRMVLSVGSDYGPHRLLLVERRNGSAHLRDLGASYFVPKAGITGLED